MQESNSSQVVIKKKAKAYYEYKNNMFRGGKTIRKTHYISSFN